MVFPVFRDNFVVVALLGASAPLRQSASVSTRLSALKCDGKVSIIRIGCFARCQHALTCGVGWGDGALWKRFSVTRHLFITKDLLDT